MKTTYRLFLSIFALFLGFTIFPNSEVDAATKVYATTEVNVRNSSNEIVGQLEIGEMVNATLNNGWYEFTLDGSYRKVYASLMTTEPMLTKLYSTTTVNVRNSDNQVVDQLEKGEIIFASLHNGWYEYTQDGQLKKVYSQLMSKEKISTIVYANTSVNIRNQDNEIIRTLKKSERIEANLFNGWYEFLEDGNYRKVYSQYMSSKPVYIDVFAKVDTNLRNRSNAIVGLLNEGDGVSAQYNNGWYEFSIGGELRKAYAGLMTTEYTEKNIYASVDTNIRLRSDNSIIGLLKKGSYAKGYVLGDYVNINYNGKQAKIHKSLAVISDPKFMYIKAASNINTPYGEFIEYKSKGERIYAVLIGEYYRFAENNAIKFVHNSKVSENELTGTVYTIGRTNLRSTSDNSIVAVVPFAQRLNGTRRGDYIYTTYNGNNVKAHISTITYGLDVEIKAIGDVAERNQNLIRVGILYKNEEKVAVRVGNYYRYVEDNAIKLVWHSYVKENVLQIVDSEESENTVAPITNDEMFRLETSSLVYATAVDAMNKTNPKSTYEANLYYIYTTYKGMINITRTEGVPGAWINPSGLSQDVVAGPILSIEGKIEKNTSYPLYKTLNGYGSSTNALTATNPLVTLTTGNYYIQDNIDNMLLLSESKDGKGFWMNPALNDMSEWKKPASDTQAFINKIYPYALEVIEGKDLYPSVMIAQAILESGWGTSLLSVEPYNNLFGVKGNYQGESIAIRTREYNSAGTSYYTLASFRKYPSYRESLMNYVTVLTANDDTSSWRYKYYLGVRVSQTKSYKDATAHLTGRYATSPDYAEALNRLIEQYNLTRFDDMLFGK